jgi:outer membrane protein assembly factor BamB
MNDTSLEIKRKTLLRVAVIAALFSLVIASLMVVNFGRRLMVEPQMENMLEDMKNVFREQIENETLADKIRQVDLEIRHDRMKWLAFSGKGSILLLCGLAVFVGSLKYSMSLSGIKPVIENDAVIDGEKQERKAVTSRWFVWGGFAVLLVFSVLTGLKPSVQYVVEDTWPQFLAGWPTFRGPDGSGVSNHADIELQFDVESGDAVLWKSSIPMIGMNSPILWGDYVFLSSGDKEKLQIYCYDANTGELVWSRDVKSMLVGSEQAEPMEETGFAAPTMAVDGKRVYAIFATGDVVAFSFTGKMVWSKNFGIPDSIYGYASSLAMYKKLLIIQYDQAAEEDGLSRLYALDGFSGQLVWQVSRPVANSWASPIIADIDGKSQIITCSVPFVISYDSATGTELWRVDCMGGDIAPSSVYAGGLVFALEPYNMITAIKPDGAGDVTETNVAWVNEDSDIPDICSPVSDGELLFMLTTEGSLTCLDVKDGSEVWVEDLGEMFQSSPSIVDGKLVIISEDGTFIVAEIAREYKEISRTELGEHCYASPAFADGRMYIRGVKNLYCIGKKN